jgi:hypothetical protein
MFEVEKPISRINSNKLGKINYYATVSNMKDLKLAKKRPFSTISGKKINR